MKEEKSSLVKTTKDKEIWFKQRKIGYGWTPCTREGWAVVLVYVAFIVFLSFYRLDENAGFEENLPNFFIPFFISTALLIYVSYLKGEKLHWRGLWGRTDVDK